MQFDAAELEGKTFRCLEGCGFCCTFQPEASQRELALLRARLKPKPLAVVVGGGRSYLGLQNKCGACTLLERRGCTAYDLRPAHCRYFPFHVHFGPSPQVYVNMTCRGVEPAPSAGPDGLRPQFDAAVLANAPPGALETHAREARETYAAFERHARKAGAWGDARAVAAEALAQGPFTRAWMERAVALGEEDATPDEMIEDALSPFAAADVTKRPFYLAPDLRWITFDGPARAVEMDEKGALSFFAKVDPPRGWQDLDATVAAALTSYLARLASPDVFAGSVYALVDEQGYGTSVEAATWWRLAEIVADLAVRARILPQLGAPAGGEGLAHEVERFYDSTFLDAPTIGGFL